jgi:hypothetical protein
LLTGKVLTHVLADTGGSTADEAFCKLTSPISAVANCKEPKAASA